MEIFSRRCKISPLIIAVIFITFFQNVLSRHRIRHLKDRFKRQQGANLYLPGSYVQDNYDPDLGPWEDWSSPSSCSMTCGGGVATQERRCTQGYECRGPSKRMFSCNTQDCPDLNDFRSQQCAYYNYVPFEGTNYEWVPYTKGPNPCELNCMPKGERFYYKHADAVVDGTRCTDESYDVCVNGKCEPVGCDRMLGSNAKEDECRVCGGNGSTCNTYTNTIPLKDMQVGYNDILLIPAGATNIRIEELAPSNNYLAVRNKSGHSYLNGNWKIDFPKSLEFAGTRFKYERTPQDLDAPDILSALGPTDESLFIILLYQGSDVPISYSYSLPTSLPPPSNERYAWIFDEFTPCSARCGRGVQYRNVSCAGRKSLVPVDEDLCDREAKPQSVQSCNEVECEPKWVIQPWSECSFPCGSGGTQTRQITCQKTDSNGLQEVVSDDNCLRIENKPNTEQKCNIGYICAKWHTDPWKPCDHLCGPGKQTRKVLCYVEKNGKKEILNEDECAKIEPKPEEVKECNIRPCEGVDWMMSQWSGCDQCGLTNETRKVFCASESGHIQPDDLCDQERKPEIVRECEVANASCQFLWYASQWSDCSAACGQGVQTRNIFCGASTAEGVKKVENEKCDPSKNFETMKNCTGEKETCDGEWFGGPWGECSKPCGGGVHTKKVICIKDGQVVDASSCDASKIEFSEETCNQQPCSEDSIIPTDITQSIDESEPTKEISQKREATTTPVSKSTKGSEDTEASKSVTTEFSTAFEVTSIPTTTENPDDFEIKPDDNCDDGEWVDEDDDESEMPQGDDPFAFDDIMLGDQGLLISSGDGLGSSSSSTWSTDSSTSTDSTWSTESSLSTSKFEGSGSTLTFVPIEESEVGARKITTTEATTVEVSGPTESTTEFTGPTESTESTTEGSTETTKFTESTESTESTTQDSTETTTEFTGTTESTESTTERSTETTTEFTGPSESTQSTTQGSMESTISTTEGPTESTTDFTGSTESTESTTVGSTESTTEFTGSTELTESTTVGSTESTTEFTGSTESTESTTVGSTESTTEFTGSTESTESTTVGSTESTTEFTGSTESTESTTVVSTESTTEFTGSTESTESTTEGSTESTTDFTGSTESTTKGSTESTTEFTGSTESTESTTEGSTESTTEFTGSTESTESTTEGSTESTTEFTGSTESTESTTEGSTESTTEFTGSTESTESTTEGSTESTTEFTGSTESTESTTEGSTESTTEFMGSTESTESTTEGSTESTTEFTGSTESTESTTEFTGSTESTESTTEGSTESTTEFTGSTESTESTTEFTGPTESTESTTEGSTESTTEFTGSTESTEGTTEGSTESTTEFTGSTESTESTTEGSTESTTEFTGSTESTESTTEGSTESTTEFTGSTESTESTTEGSTESTTEFTGSTESTESTTEGSTESTTEFTGSTESTESTTEGSTESTIEFTGSTESTESTTEGSTESSTEFTGSTESTESTTEGSTESSTEFTGSTEFTESSYGTSTIIEIFTKKSRMCKRRKVKKCQKSTFGCCWDNITPAEGPFDKGCPTPHTCKEAKYGCCDDGVSAALGPKMAGCPRSQCKETLFGCCSDNKTPAEGNDNEGCPPECLTSKFGCCDDNSTKAEGPKHKGCPEESTTEISTISTSEVSTVSGETETTSENATETGETESIPTPSGDCESSSYRCCPDGITPATGPGFQGCNLPCSESKYGCCQDAKTPAHGYSGEGCCLSSTFGCCPDNISPARGPNNIGCDCHTSPYGCCPDNKAAAQGHEKEGCGCAFSKFGCCPDGYTNAGGPDFQGCQCHTFQFGCCPDGITTAKGPHGQGCGCRNSEFGCCSDDKTPASGPNKERCTCETSKYGCCPDGTTEAKGPNFEECENIPQNLQAGCSMSKERGTCRNYTVKWFFDMDYGGCSRFWYGGCDGNENRYKSKEECEQICVNPEGPARCHLPKMNGPCEGYYPHWYYDENLKTCAQFVYGGCLGNNNRFETREECMGLCVSDSSSDPCQQKMDEGPCQGQYERYFFDKESAQCRRFSYGGCKGNNNNFPTMEACKQQCAPPGEKKDYCTEPKAEGNCTEVHATWYYDVPQKSCAPFYYTGCNGNLNNFESKEACELQCPPEIEKDVCLLPAETGDCSNYVDRWFYDTLEKTCRQFYYGGCGGNGNNFETQNNCQQRCERKTPLSTVPPEPERTPSPTFTIDQCFQPSVTGPCRAAFTRHFYDASDGVCKEFIYGGCQGNTNNFNTIEECLQMCGNAQDLCTLPPVQGSCGGRYAQYYYDQNSDSCRQFAFSGCGGNYNRFQDEQSCEKRCKKTVTEPTYTQAPTSASQAVMCFESPDPGNCDDRNTAFYYDPTRRVCQPFIYSGCGGNNNRFNSEEQCQRQCGNFRDQDICNMEKDSGACRGYFVKYYYDATTGRCNQFAYGGCQGNGNRFSSEEECAQICITHHESKPNVTAAVLCRLPVDKGSCEEGYHKRWYFDDSRGECLAFIFSGCGGNFNNFRSYQHCIDYCREFLPPPIEPQIKTDQPPHPCEEAFDVCTTLRCPYGVEPFVDENECNRCRCRDPCSEEDCLEDEQCAIDLNRNKTSPRDADFVAICRKQIKPGYCPNLDINDNDCEEECRTDADCTLHLKCCSTGCGTACVDPTPPGQLVTQQYQPGYTEGPIEAQYQPPHVNPIEYKPEMSATIGDQANLRCAVSGNPNPKITWSKDNIEIDGTQPRYRIKLDQSLQIITLHKTDSGIYLCTATNGVGNQLTNQIKLEVLDSDPRPVTILSDPGDEQPVIISLNAPATLNCHVLGYPFPAVTWWKEDSIIPFKNNEFEIRKDYSLLIHSVKLQNLGIYTCQAYNGYGKAASWSVTVKARGPITFNDPEQERYNKFIINSDDNYPTTSTTSTTQQQPHTPYRPPYIPPYTEPSNEIDPNTLPDAQAGRPPPSVNVPVRANITTNDQRYPLGSEIELPCEYSGFPTPQVQWFKDGVELVESDKIHIRETERTSVLTVEQATKADSGYYQCEVTNAYNKATSALEISIEGMYIHPSCIDNRFLANCALIVKGNYCGHKYYAKFCCKSCTEAGLIPANGPHIQNYNRQNSLLNNLV